MLTHLNQELKDLEVFYDYKKKEISNMKNFFKILNVNYPNTEELKKFMENLSKKYFN